MISLYCVSHYVFLLRARRISCFTQTFLGADSTLVGPFLGADTSEPRSWPVHGACSTGLHVFLPRERGVAENRMLSVNCVPLSSIPVQYKIQRRWIFFNIQLRFPLLPACHFLLFSFSFLFRWISSPLCILNLGFWENFLTWFLPWVPPVLISLLPVAWSSLKAFHLLSGISLNLLVEFVFF